MRKSETLILIAGLGNPGRAYAHTLHNVGFETVDLLAGRMDGIKWRSRQQAMVAETIYHDKPVALVKPQTYMNRSGEALSRLMRWYRIPPSQMVVIYDDIDLPPGTIRLRMQGGPGTHNGMRSIVEQLGTQAFPRIRVGIGKPDEQWALTDFVLSRPDAQRRDMLQEAMQRAADATQDAVALGFDMAMNRHNIRDKEQAKEHT